MPSLTKRAWRRFCVLPLINKTVLIGDDKFKAVRFCLRKSEREIQYGLFENCHNLEDFFQFSSQMFGPHQIKHEILSFLQFASVDQPKYVCEIGTGDGGTTFLLSQTLSNVSLMIAVDLYVKNRVQLRFFSRNFQQIHFVNGRSCSPGTLRKVQQILENKRLDLLFIDGDHKYEGVTQDFLNYRHLVREGGIIAFHDIVPDHYTRYGIKTGRWVGDVPRLWNRLKLFYHFHEFVEDPSQDGLGIGVIRYSNKVALQDNF
jgi:predicted O-methyltransferase YrrM